MAELEVGDVVRLKSGGPKMVVHDVEEHSGEVLVTCKWFVDGEVRKHGYFPASALSKAGPAHS